MLRMQRQMSKVQYARLKFDHDMGEGEIVFMNGFEQENWVLKADALKDWISDLERMYHNLLTHGTEFKHE